VLADGRKKARALVESVNPLQAAAALNVDDLGAVLASLGPDGHERDRLTAVVALLASEGRDTGTVVRGAFAGAASTAPEAKVRGLFTSALHGCLREQPVNAGSPATTRSV
jgi:hypothetical protein